MKRLTACALALLLAAAPLITACGSTGEDSATPPSSVLPEDPSLPELPEEPSLPEEPEEPAPEEPVLPEEPDLPEEPEEPAPEEPEEPEEPDLPAVSAQARYVRVQTNGLNIRRGAGTQYASLGQVNAGDMLHLVRREGNWYETRYRGRTAYVSADAAYTDVALLPASGNDIVERVISEGLELLGVPYVYGAVRLHDGRGNFLKNFSADAFDCSSLMQYIFYRGAGILLDVTTRTQVRQGVPVTWENIARGDLLFYTNAQRYNKTGVERIGHVALYLGENYILHTASDYAVVEPMSPVRQRYFITARRFF